MRVHIYSIKKVGGGGYPLGNSENLYEPAKNVRRRFESLVMEKWAIQRSVEKALFLKIV